MGVGYRLEWPGVYLTLDCAVVNLLTAGAQEVGRAVTDGAPRHHGRPPAGGGGGGGRDLLAEVPGSDGQTLGWLSVSGRDRDPHSSTRQLEAGQTSATSWLGSQSLLDV